MTDRQRNKNRELLYAMLMVLFILLVEYLRRDHAGSTNADEQEMIDEEQKIRPATGDIDFAQ